MNLDVLLRPRTIQMRIALSTGFCMLLASIAIIGYAGFTMNNMNEASAETQVKDEAGAQASAVRAEIEVALDTARGLAQELQGARSALGPAALTREQVNPMLREVLASNPKFVGVYTLW